MLYTKQVPEGKSYDLVVCGGGMTGVAAAVSAARRGVKTALIEKNGCLGGVATSCGVHHILGGRIYNEETGRYIYNVGGIFQEISEILIKNGGAVDPHHIDRNRNPMGWFPNLAAGTAFESVDMKVLLDELCLEAGVDLYFFTNIVDTRTENKKIKSLILFNKSGLFEMKAKAFVDCTGDADVAYCSGCDTVLGRDDDHLMAPASVELCVEHVDGESILDYIAENNQPRFRLLIKELREKGIWPFPYEIFISIRLNQPDIYMINTIRQVGINGVDGDSITQGMLEGRRENLQLFKIMKEYFPGFANARIRSISDDIGIRETRRIVGDYILSVEDLVEGRNQGECIAISSYGWDLPDPNKPSYQPMGERKVTIKGGVVHIPYPTLLPHPITNLIVAGRSISVERDVLGPIRVMAPCMGMGQAAGLASMLVLKEECSYSDIDISKLQMELKKDGCVISL